MKVYNNKDTAPIKLHKIFCFFMPIYAAISVLDLISSAVSTFRDFATYSPYLQIALVMDMLISVVIIGLSLRFVLGVKKWKLSAYYSMVTLCYVAALAPLVPLLFLTLCGYDIDYSASLVVAAVWLVVAGLIHMYYYKRKALFDGKEFMPQSE